LTSLSSCEAACIIYPFIQAPCAGTLKKELPPASVRNTTPTSLVLSVKGRTDTTISNKQKAKKEHPTEKLAQFFLPHTALSGKKLPPY